MSVLAPLERRICWGCVSMSLAGEDFSQLSANPFHVGEQGFDFQNDIGPGKVEVSTRLTLNPKAC